MITTIEVWIPLSVGGPEGWRLSPITPGPWAWLMLDGILGTDDNRSKFKAKVTMFHHKLSHK